MQTHATTEAVPCYCSCVACGAHVLYGRTATGERYALDTTIATFVVTWHHGPEPTLAPSRGYPVHQCGTKGEVCNR